MYKAVNVNEETYNQLQKIATQLNKPKAQVVASLIANYELYIEKQEKKKLEKFNTEMDKKIKTFKLSKSIEFNSDNLDEDFSSLANTEYTP